MADVDAALEQQILDVPQRERETHVHHHHEADYLWRRVKAAGWEGRPCARFAADAVGLAAAPQL